MNFKNLMKINRLLTINHVAFNSSLTASTKKCDLAVIGGGIIGTAIAREFKQRFPNMNVLLIEKECSLGQHQTSHNSGVMHCGIFYKPGSLKAKLCVEGIDLLQKYCDSKKVPYKKSGKLVLARDCSERPALQELLNRGCKNGVKDMEYLESQCEISKVAPGCRAENAIWCPQAANVDFGKVALQLFKDFEQLGGNVLLNKKVTNINPSEDCEYPVLIDVDQKILSKYAVLCGGLQTESLSSLVHKAPDHHFISMRVQYTKIPRKYCENLQTNIYPVPDLNLPFLGAHFSPQLDDVVLLGPYAMPALKVEGYNSDEVSLSYVKKLLTSCGFRNMIRNNFCRCIEETNKAFCLNTQIKELQRMIPNFSYQFVEQGPIAVQCHILNTDGTFVDDYIFDFLNWKGAGKRVINVKFTPSPAATSCLAIANYITSEFSKINL